MPACLFLTLYSCHLPATAFFSGQWGGQGKNNDGTLYSTLTLKLEQNGNQVVGTYCYVTRNGKKIDCPEDGNKNITGTAKGNQAKVFFNTGLGRGKGSANLIREGNTVAWLLNESASEDVVYAPLKYTLIKVNSSYTEAQMKTFSTPGFTVVLINRCGGVFSVCDRVKYIDFRNNDEKQIILSGKTINSEQQRKVVGMIFTNADVQYLINFNPLTLKVIKAGKVLVAQKGKWQ